MKVTEIKVFPVQEEKLKAFVSIVLDDCFMVNDIKVIQGRDGLFISMPSRRKKNGKFKDVAHPLNNDTRQMLEGLILGEYEQAVDQTSEAQSEARSSEKEEIVEVQVPSKAARSSRASWDSPSAEPANELDEVTQSHLRDSFWTT